MKQSPGFVRNTGKKASPGPDLTLPTLVILAAVLVYCLALGSRVHSGLLALGNRFLSWLTRTTRILHLPLAGGEDKNLIFILLPLGLLLLWAGIAAFRQKRAWFPALCWALGAAALCLGVLPCGWVLFLCLGLTLLFHLRRVPDAFSWRSALAAALCLALSLSLLPLAGALPQSHLRQELASAWHSLRYDSPGNAMPEGRLQDLSSLAKSGTAAMDVTMEVPQKLYLKGFVGETYTGSGWESLSGDTLADSGDLFYWLHREGFYGQSALGQAVGLTSQEASAAMTIVNRSACSARAYIPYALADNSYLDPMALGDAGIRAQGVEATLRYYPGSVPQWYEAQADLSREQDEHKAYLSLESAYDDFVQAQYLQLTSESAQAARSLLGGQVQAMTLAEIRQAVLDGLDRNLSYDETVETRIGTMDFLQYLTSVTRRGYSVHYATAATLMLRYCGVPARYVEGYFLSAEEAKDLAPGQTVTLDESHAHAWTEYYLEGVGWVPFEVTPGYRDDEELPAGSDTDQKHYENTELPPPVVEQPDREPQASSERAPLQLLWWLLGLLMLALIFWQVTGRLRLRRALARMDQAPDKEAVALYYGYARYLLAHCPGAEVPDPEARLLNQEAMFSAHPMGPGEKDRMKAYASRVLSVCRSRWNPFRRFYFHFICFIY